MPMCTRKIDLISVPWKDVHEDWVGKGLSAKMK